MELDLKHNDLVNLVCGRFCPQHDTLFTKFVGNQWNPEWDWNRNKLSQLSEEELYQFYFFGKINPSDTGNKDS
jgi:hypothetical protein